MTPEVKPHEGVLTSAFDGTGIYIKLINNSKKNLR